MKNIIMRKTDVLLKGQKYKMKDNQQEFWGDI
jgi:hypothetical protein